jgi:hypothetical protein
MHLSRYLPILGVDERVRSFVFAAERWMTLVADIEVPNLNFIVSVFADTQPVMLLPFPRNVLWTVRPLRLDHYFRLEQVVDC